MRMTQLSSEHQTPLPQPINRTSHEARMQKRDLLKSVLGEETLQLLIGKALLVDSAKSETRAGAASTRVKTYCAICFIVTESPILGTQNDGPKSAEAMFRYQCEICAHPVLWRQ